MRARDVRAIVFCVVTIAMVLVGSMLLIRSGPISVALAAAWAALVLTRPRMLRLYRRLGGEPDWSGYFDDRGQRFTLSERPRAPEEPAASPRRAERR